MKVHALARWPHLMDHLLPIWNNLPDRLIGEVILDQKPTLSHVKHLPEDDVIMVAGFPDISCAFGRRVVYVEHGAGQRYEGITNGSDRYYHGGEHPENVIAYIGPRQDVIDAWGRPGYATGSPICDPYELYSPQRTAAITFHWNGAPPNMVGVPEAGNAFDHFASGDGLKLLVDRLRANDWNVIGHRHPRFTAGLNIWKRLGVPEVDARTVRRDAMLFIADNTSMLYEMMYLGRSVIALNAPNWRRDVEHGLRFWQWAPRIQADDRDELFGYIDNFDFMFNRGAEFCDWDITNYVYGKKHSDGRDGARAAAWLTAFLADV